MSLFGILMAFALLAAACGDSDDGDNSSETAPTTEAAAEPSTTTAAPEPAEEEAATDNTEAEPAAEDEEPAAEEEETSSLGPADEACPLGRATEVADDLITLRVVIVPIVDVAPVVYAVNCGFYAKHGLEVTTEVANSGPAATQLVASGEAEMGISAWHPLSGAWLNGAPFVVAVDGAKLAPAQGAVLVAGDSDIEGLADLDGRTIGVPALGSVMDVAFRAAMQDAGLDVSNVDIVPVPITEEIAAVASGSIDAMLALEPFTTIGLAQGLKPIATDLYGGRIADATSGGFAALGPWVEANEEAVTRMRAAWSEVSAMLNGDEAGFRAFLPTYTALTPELAAVIALTEYRTTTEVANIQGAVDLTAAVGLIPETFDVTPFVAFPED